MKPVRNQPGRIVARVGEMAKHGGSACLSILSRGPKGVLLDKLSRLDESLTFFVANFLHRPSALSAAMRITSSIPYSHPFPFAPRLLALTPLPTPSPRPSHRIERSNKTTQISNGAGLNHEHDPSHEHKKITHQRPEDRSARSHYGGGPTCQAKVHECDTEQFYRGPLERLPRPVPLQ